MTEKQRNTIWAMFIFIFITVCGLVVMKASGLDWGTHEYGLGLFLTFFLSFVGVGFVKMAGDIL